mgnify:CR=1 FL=1
MNNQEIERWCFPLNGEEPIVPDIWDPREIPSPEYKQEYCWERFRPEQFHPPRNGGKKRSKKSRKSGKKSKRRSRKARRSRRRRSRK